MVVIALDVLIIGGSQFSGREMIKLLLEQEHYVTVLNRGQSEKKLPEFYLPKEYHYPKGVSVLHADRTNKEEFTNALEGKNFDAIIDTCAYNKKDIQNVMDIASKELVHYIFISTAVVYDFERLTFFPITEEGPIGSEADDFPKQYSRDKRKAETLLKKSYNENSFPMTILRPSYIYGPNNPLYRECYFFDRIIDNKLIYMPGIGEYITDFVYSKDVAWLATVPLEKKNAIGQIYNATGGYSLTLNRYVNVLSEIIGKDAKIIHYDPKILEKEELKPTNRNQMFPFKFDLHLILSREKAVLDLGYKPAEFIDGIQATFEWYLQNKNPDWKGEYTLDIKIAEYLK